IYKDCCLYSTMADFIHYEDEKGPKLYKFGKFSFSGIEIKHLLIALVMITATLMVFQSEFLSEVGVVAFVFIFLITVGLGFLLHELGHKLVAQHYGFISEFRGDFPMMLFAFALAIFSPIVFLAPGAVVIWGHVDRR